MSDFELVLYGFCAGFFVAELVIVWVWRSLPPRRGNPNPFGELPPMQPLGDVLGDEAERWTYTVIDDGAIYVGDEPKLERMVWLATLDPITREPNGGALPVAIHHNANIHARN